MSLTEILTKIDDLKFQIDQLRPINAKQEPRIKQKLRLDWNYHSNALEGNTLTLGETRAFLF
ncbi:MAG: Fic family protein, partial [Chloroflexota bacterium]